MTDDRFEAPVAVDLRTVFVGMGVLVTAATIPPEAGGFLAGRTGIMFHFGVPGYADDHVRVFLPTEAVPPQLVEMVTEAAADVVDEAIMEQIAAVARAANLASGLLPGGHSTHEPRALGAVIRHAARNRLITPTGQYQPSVRPECHARPIPLWTRTTLARP